MFIYPDDLPLVQLLKLYHDMPKNIGALAQTLALELGMNKHSEIPNGAIIVASKERKGMSDIALEFAAIEAQIAAEKEAGELVDSGCDYHDTPAQQTADSMTRWMQ